ncbi:TadE/TadG family type IV pilus assembly protein [Paracandidimonas lactea]|uniref:TadE/TadG family type IV pilus assembly protein n=1 Tax=Paracandidimonas lactea TaxID=2895524 RepID=UPI001F2478AC|nr:TadE family protein [Paracandidimonas lactea]
MHRGERGTAAVEAAIIFPLAVFLVFACVEMYQYFRSAALLDRAAFSVANGVALQRELFNQGACTQANDICVYGIIAKDVFQPLDFSDGGSMIISAYAATEPDVNGDVTWKSAPEWSATFKGSSPSVTAPVSKLTDTSAFPQVRVGDTIIVAETFYDYEPFAVSGAFWNVLAGTKSMYSRFFFRPRFDDLRVLH